MNSILERAYQDVSDLMANTSWAIRSTIDIVPEASQLAAIFGRAYNSIYPSLLIDIQLGKIGKAIDHNTTSYDSRSYDHDQMR